MRRLFIIAALAAVALCGCKSEKKINQYSSIYNEKPTMVYVAPIDDRAERKPEKFPKDIAYNNEVNTASAYLMKTVATPLLNNGYYVMGPVAERQIAEAENKSAKEWHNGDLKPLHQKYGADAVLIITVHRWVEGNGIWTAYLEYRLRSTHSNSDLMHTWVMATKTVPINLKGNPTVMKNDTKFAERLALDNGTAQRCFIVEKVNDYVLRNLPVSSSRRQFERDRYEPAVPTYLKYTWTDEGGSDVKACPQEEYEQGCFI